ncbi:hypothetical protein ACWD4O_07610 [Streptomyces sp. NPDC002623]
MNGVSASELLAAFEPDSEVSIQAKNALLSGAHLNVWLEPVPASRLLGILGGRVRTMQRRGRPIVGATECLASLAEMGERGLLVAELGHRERVGYYFRLYLDPHPLKVVGCIGIDISPGDDPATGSA